MLELSAADVVCVNGDVMYTFLGVKGLNPRQLRGQEVQVDGRTEIVKSVETYAIQDATGHNFGLIVVRSGVKRA